MTATFQKFTTPTARPARRGLATARHLAFKFAQAFVADEPPASLVNKLADNSVLGRVLAAGLRAVPRSLSELMYSLRASRAQLLFYLEIPAALPIFLGGLRIGATLAVIGAIVGMQLELKDNFFAIGGISPFSVIAQTAG